MLSFTVNETLQMRLRTLMWGDYAGLGVGPSVITAAPDKSEREAGVSGVRLGDTGLFKHLISYLIYYWRWRALVVAHGMFSLWHSGFSL